MNKQSEKLAKAIAYEAKKKKERDEDKRPAFHVTPTTGWCNDPNGFSRFGEAYHLFYSGHFKNILKPSEVRERLLYDGEADGTASWQKVEEYLRGCRQKKPQSSHEVLRL